MNHFHCSAFRVQSSAFAAALLLFLCMGPAAPAQNLLRSKPQRTDIGTFWNSNFFAIEIPRDGTNSTQLGSASNVFNSVLQAGTGVTLTYKTNGVEISATGSGSGQGASAALTNLSIAYTTNVFVYASDNLASAVSNAANGTRLLLMPGSHQITSRFIFSNSLGQAGVNLFNKTNIQIEAAIPGTARIFTTNIGDMFFITNSARIAIRNLEIEGWVVTNYASTTLYSEPGVVWGAINLYDVADFELSGSRIINHHDHALQGTGANINWNGATTNRILVFNNYFANIGSARTNAGITIDGTAVVPDGPWEIYNNTFEACLRAIEPYSDNDTSVRPWSGTRIQGNTFKNIIDSAILSAGSTNANEVVIQGNTFIREVGFTRRGTNFIPSSAAVDFNGGYGWKTHGNLIVGEWGRGIYYWNGTKYGEIKDNTLMGITNSGSGVAVPIDLQVGYQHTVSGNVIRWSEGQSIYAYGLRDSTIRNNSIDDPFSEVGLQIATFGGQVSSNLTISGNTIRGATNAIWDQGLSGSLALRFFGNEISGYTGNAYNLGATTGSEITIRTFDTHGGTNQLATLGNLNVASNSLYSAIGSGASGTNNPVLSASPSVAIIANQTARAMFTTNASFSWTITGASNQSTIVEVELANTSTNTIFATNALAPHVVEYGSNVTTLAIAPTSKLITRSWLNRSNEWVMTTLGAPYALTFSGSGVTLTTNHTTKTVDAAISSSGGSSTFNETNITVSTTNEIVIDPAAFQIVRVRLLTNLNSVIYTNVSSMGRRSQVYWQQDTNGTRTIANNRVSGGLIQTNANLQPTTNANALDMLELMPGFFTTNLLAWWPQNFQPRVAFTNSLDSGSLAFNYALSNVAANAYSAWSPARLLTNAWSSALALVVRSSDGATNYIVANNATNNLPTIVSWAGSANVYVTNLFDQTGNGRHMVNGATNTCPVIITNGVPITKNGFFVMRFLDDDFLSTASLAPSLPLTYVVSVLNDSRTAGDMIFFGNSSSRTVIKQGSTAVYTITSGALDVSTTDALTLDQWGVVTAIFQTGDDVVQLDNGAEVTGGAGDNTPTALAIGSSTIAADMQVSDIFVYNSALTSAQYGILRTNVVNFYQHP